MKAFLVHSLENFSAPISAANLFMTRLWGLRVDEFQPVIAEPRDFRLVFVEICLTQNRVVRPAIKVHNNAMTGFYFNSIRRFHKLSIHALRFALIAAVELAGKPATATGHH